MIKKSSDTMMSDSCEFCGHVYGENNRFVQRAHCCPQCGEKVNWHTTRWRPYKRIAIGAIAGVLLVLGFIITSILLQT